MIKFNLTAFTATAVVNESVSAEENPSDGDLSKDADLQEAYKKPTINFAKLLQRML